MPAFKKIPKGSFGRPPRISRQLIETITNLMRAGVYMETACIVNGVSKNTLKTWCKIGHKRPESIYGRFLTAVHKAAEECEVRDIVNVDKAAMGAQTEYMRYPQGTVIKDSFGNDVDVSGAIVYSEKGKPMILKQGHAPDWHASRWRMSKRNSMRWGESQEIKHTGNAAPQINVYIPDNGKAVDDKKGDE